MFMFAQGQRAVALYTIPASYAHAVVLVQTGHECLRHRPCKRPPLIDGMFPPNPEPGNVALCSAVVCFYYTELRKQGQGTGEEEEKKKDTT